MNPENMVGKRVKITDKTSYWYGHWGYIKQWDGNVFHVEGGSISLDGVSTYTPIFDRDQFKIYRVKPV